MNTNTIIIDKHNSSLHISNKITDVQRKNYNYMLKIAKNSFNEDKNRRVFQITADELLYFFNLGEKNHTYIKEELEALNNTQIRYNFLGKDKGSERWGSFSLIAGFEYKNGIIEYSFPHQIIDMILEPKIFGKINLVIVKSLKSRYSIALYELAKDYINARIPQMTIEECRTLIGLGEKQYPKFSMFKKHVLDVALFEINSSENMEFTMSYELETKGRSTTHIKFIVHKKENTEQAEEKQINFYRWQNLIVDKYKEQSLCNNLTELKYPKWTLFFIDEDGFLGKDVDGNRKILEKEEALEILEFLFENPQKIEVVPLSKLDILRKDFRGKEIEQMTTTALGAKSVFILKLIEFKEENEHFFIEIEQEDGSRFWTIKSFSFEEILRMEFVE